MKKLMALGLAAILTASASMAADFLFYGGDGYLANDSMGTRIAYDGFRNAVKQQMDTTRLGGGGSQGFAQLPSFSSDMGMAMAPSSRNGGGDRQLDCVYNSGFKVWADGFGSWANQDSNDGDGYKYSNGGFAIGGDWSSGGFTVGLATAFSWGQLDGQDYYVNRRTNSWAISPYVQWTNGKFYINADAGYQYSRFKNTTSVVGVSYSFTPPAYWLPNYSTGYDSYKSHSWNIGAEAGYKFNLGNFAMTPHVGLRYFNNQRNSYDMPFDTIFPTAGYAYEANVASLDKESYHVLELPIGINVGYEFRTGGMAFLPEVKFAWIPELDRVRPGSSGVIYNSAYPNLAAAYWETPGAERSRQGFMLGAGMKARLTSMISAHLDYEFTFRSHATEHHLNAGIGFSF